MLLLNEIDLNEKVGSKIEFMGLVTSSEMKKNKLKENEEQKYYMNIDISCKGTNIRGKIWDCTEDISEQIIDKVFLIRAEVQKYRNEFNLIIEEMEYLEDAKISDFVIGDPNQQQSINLLNKIIEYIDENSIYKKLVDILIIGNMDKIKMHPAAVSQHHNYAGGWLQHTVEVATYSIRTINNTNLNKSLAIAGALLHDIGKLEELAINYSNMNISYTTKGTLLGHITLGIEMIDKVLYEMGELSIEDRYNAMLLKHIILSHHGRKDWGSPKEPSFPEALIVHQSDVLSFEVSKHIKHTSSLNTGEIFVDMKNGMKNYMKI